MAGGCFGEAPIKLYFRDTISSLSPARPVPAFALAKANHPNHTNKSRITRE